MRKGFGAKNMAVVRHFALNLVRSAKDKRSIKLRRKVADWTPEYLDKLLNEKLSYLDSEPWAGARTKASYLQAQFHRLRGRRGAKKAVGAVASMLTAAYHMLKDGTEYHDIGAGHFDKQAKATQTTRLVRRLQNLGFTVSLTPVQT